MAKLTAFRSGWVRSGLRRVHIVRTTPVPEHPAIYRERPRPPQGWCGQPARGTIRSGDIIPVDPAVSLPEGLHWCAVCVGRAADHAGILPEVVRLLLAAEVDTGSTT